MGNHIWVTKYCCFLFLWDNHSRCYCGSLWNATFVHKKLICSWSIQCSASFISKSCL